jgi:chaperonin GroES
VAINTLIELNKPGEYFAPSHDFLLIQPVEAPDRTNGGIILPTGMRAPTKVGKVIATGPGNISPFGQMIPMDHKIGDTVVVNPTSMVMEIKVQGASLLLVRDCECLGVVLNGEPQAAVAPAQPAAKPVEAADGEAGEGTTYVAETSNQN